MATIVPKSASSARQPTDREQMKHEVHVADASQQRIYYRSQTRSR